MHGRPRKNPKPEEEAAATAKAEKLRVLQSQFLFYHHNCTYTKEALELSAKLLETNPECYTAWNYRKLAFQQNYIQSESDPDSVKAIIEEELRVVESALRQNFKSYGAWYHRKWVLSKGYSSVDHELRLVDRFQKVDSRNFHAWNYRRFVAALMNRSAEDELKYTTAMINDNFSNYSAWHNRSVLLSDLLKRKVQGFFPKEKVLDEEYELVHRAIFTDPDDQSGWFYYLWLLDQNVKTDAPILVSSWPAHNSNLLLLEDRGLDEFSWSPLCYFYSDPRTFPLLLYFNQAVEGVNSSTVTIKSSFSMNDDVIWKPLSSTNSVAGQVWVANLKFPDKKLCGSEACAVEVTLGHSQGIISSSGFAYSRPTQISFQVSFQFRCAVTQPNKKQDEEIILWKDENFHVHEAQNEGPNPLVSLGQLTIEDNLEPRTSNWQVEAIANEIALFRELLSEIDCKIGKLTLARLLKAYDFVLSQCADKMVHSEEILKLYSDLIELDPSHSWYYKDEHSLVFLQQVSSDKGSLLRHCYQYRNETASNSNTYICLRLNNLSLSRMGSINNLLWIQMLDLSHNELRSTEGLEAMQLLSCLNLSHNKLASFTSLGPLRLLKSLKVLNISHNEIGSHSIDAMRYLCSSPLSHTEEIDWNADDIITGDYNVKNYWEAILIFKGSNLRQLDISRNPIADEKFKSFLIRLLPKLQWLDGESLH